MQWALDRLFSSIKEVVARSVPHHRGYARERGFCWHDAFKALLAWQYTYHHLQQWSTPMFSSPSSVLPEIVTKLLVSFLCLLVSAKSYPLISYLCDLSARQLIYVLGLPAQPTLVRSSELATLLLCITHTSPLFEKPLMISRTDKNKALLQSLCFCWHRLYSIGVQLRCREGKVECSNCFWWEYLMCCHAVSTHYLLLFGI